MVWLRTVVLGRIGRTENSHPRASALSCPPFAIYGRGFRQATRPSFLHLGSGSSVVAPSRLRNGNFGELLLAVHLGKQSHKDVRHLYSHALIVTYPQTIAQAVDNSGRSNTKYCVSMKGRNLVPFSGVSGERERRIWAPVT